MRIVLAGLVLALSGAASAQPAPIVDIHDEIVFNSASQLYAWCEDEARAHFAGKGSDTYQWSGRHFEHGDTLEAEGKLRVDGNDVPVTCRVARGARERHAVVSIAS